jgi:hypothetical protein
MSILCSSAEENSATNIMQPDFLTRIKYQNSLYNFEGNYYNYLYRLDTNQDLSKFICPTQSVESRKGILNRWHIAYGNLWQICDKQAFTNQPTTYVLSRLPMVDLPKYTVKIYDELVRSSEHDRNLLIPVMLSSMKLDFCDGIGPLMDYTLRGKEYYDFLPTSENSVTLYICTNVHVPSPQFQVWHYTGHWSDHQMNYIGEWTETDQWNAPFFEPFITTTHSSAVYFITLSGDVYLLNHEKKSLDKIWNNTQGPALACVTDLDSDQTCVYGRDYMFEVPKLAKPVIFNNGDAAILQALSKEVGQKDEK